MMEDERILAAACAYVECTLSQVLAYHVYEDCIVLVVDRGIKGGPKYTVPLAELGTALPDDEAKMDAEVGKKDEAEIDATPAARRLAKEFGIELFFVEGSGADGRILKNDVEAKLAEGVDDEGALC